MAYEYHIKKRKLFNIGSTFADLVADMSEGNPGCINVLMSMVKQLGIQATFEIILNMDDMDIRGPQVWLGFKDWAGGDMAKFKQACLDRSEEMINCINKESAYPEYFPFKAVKSGASYR